MIWNTIDVVIHLRWTCNNMQVPKTSHFRSTSIEIIAFRYGAKKQDGESNLKLTNTMNESAALTSP